MLSNTYTIKKGNHYAGWSLPALTRRDYVDYWCTLRDDCRYVIDGIDQYDINKLPGISTTWNHHRQSARLGWRCIDGQFQLLPYSYVAGSRVTTDTILTTVQADERFRVRIEDAEHEYRYHIWSLSGYYTHQVPKLADRLWFDLKWVPRPYFGGNVPAPHTMTILISWL